MNTIDKIQIKILSCRDTQRYVVRRAVIAACEEIRETHPDLEISIEVVKEHSEMEKYTPVMILPSLVINEKLVCVGRFPKKSEVITWLQEVTSQKMEYEGMKASKARFHTLTFPE